MISYLRLDLGNRKKKTDKMEGEYKEEEIKKGEEEGGRQCTGRERSSDKIIRY